MTLEFSAAVVKNHDRVTLLSWPGLDNAPTEPFFSTPNSVLGHLRHEVEKGRHMGLYLAQAGLYTTGTPLIYIADGGIAICAGIADGLTEAGHTPIIYPSLPKANIPEKLPEAAEEALLKHRRVILCEDVIFWGNRLRNTLATLPKPESMDAKCTVIVCSGRMNTKYLDPYAQALATTSRQYPHLDLHYITPHIHSGKDQLKTSQHIAELRPKTLHPKTTEFAQRLVDMLQKPENKRSR